MNKRKCYFIIMGMFLRQTAKTLNSRLNTKSINFGFSRWDRQPSRLQKILEEAKGLEDQQTIIDPQYIALCPTFHQQVLSCVLLPQLIGRPHISYEASQRASLYLNEVKSVGSYSTPLGTPSIRKNIAKYIQKSTGIKQPSIDSVILMPGASHAIRLILRCLIVSQNDSIMWPNPGCYSYKNITQIAGGNCTDYNLDKNQGWKIDIKELEKSYQEATKNVLINPGNPTGTVYDQSTLESVVKFAHEHKLLIIADEVNSDYIHDPTKTFLPIIKAITQMGQKYLDQCQVMTLYSMEKTPFGITGVKAGYIHCHNINSDVLEQFFKLWNMCYSSNICGQIALDLVKTPFLSNASEKIQQQYQREQKQLSNYMKRRVNLVEKYFQGIKDLRITKIQAGINGFVQLSLPGPMIVDAHCVGLQLDEYFCQIIMQSLNLQLTPGTTYGHHTYNPYFSINILNGTEAQLGTKLQHFKSVLKDIRDQYNF